MINQSEASSVVPERFVILPESVLFDPDLPGDSVRVYGFLVWSLRKGKKWTSVGIRLIARELSLTDKTVVRSLRALEAGGHIVKGETHTRGERASYCIVSGIFNYVTRRKSHA